MTQHEVEGEQSSRIQLSFDKGPKDFSQGFVFGRDPAVCDVIIGDRGDKISKHHFSITFDTQSRLVVRDHSTRGTAVSYNGQGAKQPRSKFTWVIFPGIKKIEIIVVDLRFTIELADHSGCGPEYEELVKAYLQEAGTAVAPISRLKFGSNDPTAPTSLAHSPKQLPIYYKEEELGRGEFGTVYRAVDVSSGSIYACKEFSRGDWRREVKIMEGVLHVSIRLSTRAYTLTI